MSGYENMKRFLIITISVLLLVSSYGYTAELNLNNLDFPFGVSVDSVAKIYDIESDSLLHSVDPLWSNYSTNLDTLFEVNVETDLFFYDGLLYSVDVNFNETDSAKILDELRNQFGLPIIYKKVLIKGFLDMRKKYYWFPSPKLVIEYSIIGTDLTIFTLEQELRRCDIVCNERTSSAKKKHRFDVRNVMWGMTASEVRKRETATFVVEHDDDQDHLILYADNIFGISLEIVYYFRHDRLYEILYSWEGEYSDNYELVKYFQFLRDQYSEKYGEPNDCYPPSIDSGSISTSDLIIGETRCNWSSRPKIHDNWKYNRTTTITLNLYYAKSGSTMLTTRYHATIHDKLIRIENLQFNSSKF